MWLVIIIGIIFVIGVFIAIRDKIREIDSENIAKDVLKDFNFDKEKEEILNIADKPIVDRAKVAIEQIPKDKKCPLCGSLKVLREGKYGLFWGCKRYPFCKFTGKYKKT